VWRGRQGLEAETVEVQPAPIPARPAPTGLSPGLPSPLRLRRDSGGRRARLVGAPWSRRRAEGQRQEVLVGREVPPGRPPGRRGPAGLAPRGTGGAAAAAAAAAPLAPPPPPGRGLAEAVQPRHHQPVHLRQLLLRRRRPLPRVPTPFLPLPACSRGSCAPSQHRPPAPLLRLQRLPSAAAELAGAAMPANAAWGRYGGPRP